MDNKLFEIQEFRNANGKRRYKLIWAETGEIAEDYQGWGTKDPEILERRSYAIIKERREKFCFANKELLSGAKNSKDVEKKLADANVKMPIGLTPLKIFREINGTNEKVRNDYINAHTDNEGNYYRRYVRNGQLYEETYSSDGECISLDINGNTIF